MRYFTPPTEGGGAKGGAGGAAPFGSGGGEQLATETGYPLLAKLPLEPEVGEILNQGKNPFTEATHSELLKMIEAIAAQVGI